MKRISKKRIVVKLENNACIFLVKFVRISVVLIEVILKSGLRYFCWCCYIKTPTKVSVIFLFLNNFIKLSFRHQITYKRCILFLFLRKIRKKLSLFIKDKKTLNKKESGNKFRAFALT
ncbi:MAG: hypothetical protein COZ18_12565 [Flexibacter sp. CG_4_10_14_3_um_filter_32_15]|nr:MAG: hypothetical protein COZ18_12565 [Flexibacter sp. CG_4_10_14_3_um_filter_32_15]